MRYTQSNWNEIGRPLTLEKLVGQEEFVEDAKEWNQHDSWPAAILLHGRPGVGKTTAARIIARSVLGDYYDPVNYVESNASDDRGIDFIRNELKILASTKPIGADRRVVLLDEADGLTKAAQDAARQIIENYASNCLIIMTANNLDKITTAIQSRCAVYQFKPLTAEEGAIHLTNVCEILGLRNVNGSDILKHWEEHFPRLVTTMGGDLRGCVNVLESTQKKQNALVEKIRDIDVISDSAVASLDNEWMEMRIAFHKAINQGRDRAFVMRSFYQNISSFFDVTDRNPKLWDILAVYGDMMNSIYEWPDSDAAFMDCFIAKLRKELKN